MISEYSLWWLIPILIISVLASALLYYFPKKKLFTKRQNIILFSLRFLSVFLILSLIIFPIINNRTQRIEKPIIVFAQDNSSSILKTKDSIYYKEKYKKEVEKIIRELDKDYDIRLIGFGDKTKEIKSLYKEILYNDYATDVSNLFNDIEEKYYNSNLSGVVLLSDGIINKGGNSTHFSKESSYPIYTIALGDTTQRKDLMISNLRYNKFAFSGNQFPLEIIINAYKSKNNSSRVSILSQGKTIFQERFNIDEDNYSKTFTHLLQSTTPGINKFTISLDIIENESIIANNKRDIFIEVLDSKQKVLILAQSPHADISSIKQSIEKNENYEVESQIYNRLADNIKDYSLIVLHQIPTNNAQDLKDIERIRELNIPILYIIGSKTNLSNFNKLNTGIRITTLRNNQNEALANYNTNFSQFSITKETQEIISDFPPLLSPFGNYDIGGNLNILAYQSIANVKTKYPLIAFANNTSNKEAFIIGEGVFRWRLQNYLISENHKAFDEIISKTIQYITITKNTKPLRLIHNEIYSENEPVNIDAELYNESFELINTPEVKLRLRNKERGSFEYDFGKTNNAYHLNLGLLPSGTYELEAITNFANKTLKDNSTLIVSSLNLEEIDLKANHNLLFNLSNQSSGKFYTKDNMKEIVKDIKANKEILPVIYTDTKRTRLIDLWWYMGIIILLLSTEYFLRKYFNGI